MDMQHMAAVQMAAPFIKALLQDAGKGMVPAAVRGEAVIVIIDAMYTLWYKYLYI